MRDKILIVKKKHEFCLIGIQKTHLILLQPWLLDASPAEGLAVDSHPPLRQQVAL